MKRVFLIAIITCFITIFNCDIAYSGDFKKGDYLEKNQWGALEELLNDWKDGKITTDECALYGCYVLIASEPARDDKNSKIKLLPQKYQLNKKSTEKGPYFFIHFLYKYEETFDIKTTTEFRNSEWSDHFAFQSILEPNVTNCIEQIPLFSPFLRKKYRNVFSTMSSLVENKRITPEVGFIILEIYMHDIHRFYKFLKKFHFSSSDRIPEFEYIDIYKKYIKNASNRNFIKVYKYYQHISTNKYSQKTKTFTNKDWPIIFETKGTVTDLEISTYNKYFQTYIEAMCNKVNENNALKFKPPVNYGTGSALIVVLDNEKSEENTPMGFTEAINNDGHSPVLQCQITLYLKQINAQKLFPVEKIIIHELCHSIQYSYDDKSDTSLDKYHWYKYDNSYGFSELNFISESTSVWAEDFFYKNNNSNNNYLSTVLCSPSYFFKSNNNFHFPEYGMLSLVKEENIDIDDRACGYGFIWNYFCNLFKPEDFFKIWENIAFKRPVDSISLVLKPNNFTLIDFVHLFSINNFFVTKNLGVYQEEKYFSLFQTPMKINYTIIDNLLQSDTNNPMTPIKIAPLETKFLRILPGKSNNYFKNAFTLDIKWDKPTKPRITVITAWYDVNNNDDVASNTVKYSKTDLNLTDTAAQFKYYTKKGINPAYFVVAVTNDGQDGIWTTNIIATMNLNLSNSDENASLPSYDLIAKAGQEYEQGIKELFSTKIIEKMTLLDKQICLLYDEYLLNHDEYTGKQIAQYLLDINILMQTTLVQVHDLRYQFYLYKNICVNNITNGASQTSIIDQIKRLDEFVKKVNINNYIDSIDMANAFIVYNHADTALRIAKPINPADWAEMSQDSYNKINKISKTVNKDSKYPYWYTQNEIKDGVNSPVSLPEDECKGTVPPMIGPFSVNWVPNVRRNIEKAGIAVSYKISDSLKKVVITVGGQTYSVAQNFCVTDNFDPLSLKYFSLMKKHKYHEDNMPPSPLKENIKNYVDLLGYYISIGKNYSLNNMDIFYNPRISIIGGASDRIHETIEAIAGAIIKEAKNGKNDLSLSLNKELSSSLYKDEISGLLEKQLKKDGFRE